jgi:hypothetical protein
MRKIFLILIILGIFVTASTVCAVEYTSLKTPKNFKAFDTFGVSEKETDGRVQLTVVPINDTAVKYMTGNGDKSQDNIYKYTDFGYSPKDGKFGYDGYSEVIEIDGEQYIASVLFESKMSKSEETEFLNALTEFNSLNNLKPVAV